MAQRTARTVESIRSTSSSAVVEPPAGEGFFNDFRLAMHDYPEQFVTLEIVEVEFEEGDVINKGETGKFMVQLTNNGMLDMTGVILKVRGRAGMLVKTGGAADFEFRDELTIAMDTDPIPGNGGVSLTNGSKLQFQAPASPKPAGTQLLKATIHVWNASLAHLLNVHSHTEVDAPAGIYENAVVDE